MMMMLMMMMMMMMMMKYAGMQLEARATRSTVPHYENLEDDVDIAAAGYGTKLAYMYKQKCGAYSKVHNTAVRYVSIKCLTVTDDFCRALY